MSSSSIRLAFVIELILSKVLGMKSVEFAAELFVVLQHGRHANLSIAQFTQERGAASSFYKVVDTLQLVLRERGLLVEDPVKVKKMAKMIPK